MSPGQYPSLLGSQWCRHVQWPAVTGLACTATPLLASLSAASTATELFTVNTLTIKTQLHDIIMNALLTLGVRVQIFSEGVELVILLSREKVAEMCFDAPDLQSRGSHSLALAGCMRA